MELGMQVILIILKKSLNYTCIFPLCYEDWLCLVPIILFLLLVYPITVTYLNLLRTYWIFFLFLAKISIEQPPLLLLNTSYQEIAMTDYQLPIALIWTLQMKRISWSTISGRLISTIFILL